MFKIECFCEDKYLADILRALAGKALNVVPVPVPNAKASNGKVEARTSGDAQALFRQYLIDKQITNIGANGIREFQSYMGRAPNGYSLVLKNAIRSGLLRKVKGATNNKGTTYDVIGLDAPAQTATAPTNGSASDRSKEPIEDRFRAWAKEHNVDFATIATLRQFQKDIGRSPTGAGFLRSKLKARGALKRPKDAKTRATGYHIVH